MYTLWPVPTGLSASPATGTPQSRGRGYMVPLAGVQCVICRYNNIIRIAVRACHLYHLWGGTGTPAARLRGTSSTAYFPDCPMLHCGETSGEGVQYEAGILTHPPSCDTIDIPT